MFDELTSVGPRNTGLLEPAAACGPDALRFGQGVADAKRELIACAQVAASGLYCVTCKSSLLSRGRSTQRAANNRGNDDGQPEQGVVQRFEGAECELDTTVMPQSHAPVR